MTLTGDFNTEKIRQATHILNSKGLTEMLYHFVNSLLIVSCQNNVINIDKHVQKGALVRVNKQGRVRLGALKAKRMKDCRKAMKPSSRGLL